MFFLVYLCFLLQSFVESTDLAITYKHQILIVRDVDASVVPNISDEIHYFSEKSQTGYPVGLAYDPASKSLLIADLDDSRADIRAVTLGSQSPVQAVSVVPKYGTSTIETVAYDTRQKLIFWSDPFKNSIYSATKSKSNNVPKVVEHPKGSKPRGVAIDSCNSKLYWSDRGNNQGIFEQNLISGKTSTIIEKQQSKFYQAVAYDANSNELWWAETSTDLAQNSSCTISSLKENKISTQLTLANCYPFSMTFDRNFIYWSDWAKGGIMRLSRTNPSDVVKVFETPPFTTNLKEYHGSYGVVNLNQTIVPCEHDSIAVEDTPSQDVRTEFETRLEKDVTEKAAVPEIAAPLQTDDDEMKNPVYNFIYDHFVYLNAGLMLLCVFITLVTCILLVRSQNLNKELRRTLDGLKQTPFGRPIYRPDLPKLIKKPRRFSPSILKPKPPCSDDGVHIDIENCCQMTLCERPCYTSMSRQGKSYITPSLMKSDDKLRLLDDSELA